MHKTIPTPEMLASLGAGQIAYVKALRSEDAARLYPQAAQLKPGLRIFALHAADGTPMMLADSIGAAVQNAWENELVPVAVH